MDYRIWGAEGIDDNTIQQMNEAASMQPAVAAALMPDAHLGYGLPIGGVLALDNAVCPYAVGVDIACRMKVSIWPIEGELSIRNEGARLASLLESETFFGVGGENEGRREHEVFDKDWTISPITLENLEKAKRQVGTSGSGNHFAEFGICNGLLALMTHSGSRGAGAAVCNYYSKMAQYQNDNGHLSWLDLDTAMGQEYWAAMNLMGDYAAANHDCIHRAIANEFGVEPSIVVENHHNFAWKETHGGKEVIVHRKGATPAADGQLGVIPGSMGTASYIVRGKGNAESLCSSSHGAGRLMSRSQAKKKFNYQEEIKRLEAKGIEVLSAGADELCGAYKDIDVVMACQQDLVDIVWRFDPKIVKMAA